MGDGEGASSEQQEENHNARERGTREVSSKSKMRKRWYKKTSDWLVIWASGLLTFIVIYRSDAPALTSVASILGAVVIAYVGGNKAIDFRHGPEQEKEHDQ